MDWYRNEWLTAKLRVQDKLISRGLYLQKINTVEGSIIPLLREEPCSVSCLVQFKNNLSDYDICIDKHHCMIDHVR
jgi:hypothetical protein